MVENEMIRVEFVPMDQAAFRTWKESTIRQYADEKVTSGQWAAEGADERSRHAVESGLPQGLSTPERYLRSIVALTDTRPLVGSLYWAEGDHPGGRTGFILDLVIHEAFRRQGYAQAAMQALEAHCRQAGLRSLSLHVFAFNRGAVSLYEKLGYETTSFNMTLQLS